MAMPELRLPDQSDPIQHLINEITNARASVTAGRWVAVALVIASTSHLKFPNSQVWYVAMVASGLCVGAAIYYRNKITVDELRNIKLLGLCVVQFLIGVAVMYVETMTQSFGMLCAYILCSSIARFMLLLRNPVR
jgi:hypothetical protein